MTLGLMLLFENRIDFKETLNREIDLINSFKSVIDTVWLTEHHNNRLKNGSNPLTLLAYLSNKTQLNLGTATLLLSLYDPVYIAEILATLSYFTEKELYIGVAKGGRSELKNSHLNLNEEQSRESLKDKLQTLNNLFDNKTLMVNSKKISLSPEPKLKPKFSIASLNRELIEFASQNEFDIMVGHKWNLESIEQIKSIYKNAHKDKKEPKIILSRIFYPTENRDRAISQIKADIEKNRTKVKIYNPSHEPKKIDERIFDESLIGDREYISEQLSYFEKLGTSHLILRPAFSHLTTSIKGYL